MANAVTAYRLYAIESSRAVSPITIQFVELTITGVVGDVAWDLNDAAGTFWTAAEADATYGATATLARKALLSIAKQVDSTLRPSADFLNKRLQIAVATGATDYQLTVTDNVPVFTFHAGDGGPTAEILVMSFIMKAGFVPLNTY